MISANSQGRLFLTGAGMLCTLAAGAVVAVSPADAAAGSGTRSAVAHGASPGSISRMSASGSASRAIASTSGPAAAAAKAPGDFIWSDQAVFSPPDGEHALADGVDTDLKGTGITLPRAGTYALDAVIRGHLQGAGPVWAHIVGSIYDVTADKPVPFSGIAVAAEVIHYSTSGGLSDVGTSGDAHVLYTVDRPTRIRLRAQYVDVGAVRAPKFYNTPTIHSIVSRPGGFTTLRANLIP